MSKDPYCFVKQSDSYWNAVVDERVLFAHKDYAKVEAWAQAYNLRKANIYVQADFDKVLRWT